MLHSLLQFTPEKMTVRYTYTLDDLLESREELMSDIKSIIEKFFYDKWGNEYIDAEDELIKTLCDSVYANFPSN
jgi:hypothetical protein